MTSVQSTQCRVYLVCGGLYHDFDYAQTELLAHLKKYPNIRSKVGVDYSNTEAIKQSDAIITYTTDVIPNDVEQDALEEFLENGGRWFALHGTNSKIEIDEAGYASSPRTAPRFMALLGTQFIAHPKKGVFTVQVTQPQHPLVAGVSDFEVDDELYLVETHGDIDVLLHTHFNGKAMGGFVERDFFSDEMRPIMYTKRVGAGAILYLNLGHCRGHHDMRPLMDWYPEVERCSWESDVFHTLLDRGVAWLQESTDRA